MISGSWRCLGVCRPEGPAPRGEGLLIVIRCSPLRSSEVSPGGRGWPGGKAWPEKLAWLLEGGSIMPDKDLQFCKSRIVYSFGHCHVSRESFYHLSLLPKNLFWHRIGFKHHYFSLECGQADFLTSSPAPSAYMGGNSILARHPAQPTNELDFFQKQSGTLSHHQSDLQKGGTNRDTYCEFTGRDFKPRAYKEQSKQEKAGLFQDRIS